MFKRVDELMADFRVIELMGSKPNYAELGRKYGLDPRTVKKYHNGYEGKPKLSNVRLFKDSLVKIIGDVFDCYDLIINLFGGQCQII